MTSEYPVPQPTPARDDDDTAVIPAPPPMTTTVAAMSEKYDAAVVHDIFERKNLALYESMGRVGGFAQILRSNLERGIESTTSGDRRAKYGANVLPKKNPVRFWDHLVDALKDRIIILLIIAAIIQIIFGLTLPNPHTGEVDREKGWIEGTAILVSVAVVVLVGSINNYQKAKRFEEMERDQSVTDVQVFRDGVESTIKSDEIVVGDVLVVDAGTELTVDGLVISASDLKTNESAMTGEPDLIKKGDRDPFLVSGTLVEEGNGKALVVAVGELAFKGRLKSAVEQSNPDTPLQIHLSELGKNIGKIGTLVAILLLIALCIKEGVLISQGASGNASTFLNFVILAIAVIVVAIPEGLPLAVTISLAFGMKAMMEENCLVRVLASCETMGGATAVCSDKTGTLTTNAMTLVQGWAVGEEFVLGGYGLNPRHKDVHIIHRSQGTHKFAAPAHATSLVCDALSLNSTARQQIVDGTLSWIGNKTEQGLLGYLPLVGADLTSIRSSIPDARKKQFPFNSKKKRMTTAAMLPTDGVAIYVKGASELVLGDCTTMIDARGELVPLADAAREELDAIIEDMANQGNRTIAVAYTVAEGAELPTDEPETHALTLLAVFGIQDPIREVVPDAVLRCRGAGITVRMVTGDNINTAIAIAKKCHIISDEQWDVAMTGEDFRAMFKEQRADLLDLLPRLRVLARSSPHDKFLLVGLLQELGDVVGVTGDGTNDAPALKLANVGFAMQVGTDIAKGASDMVLLDNNFASVVNAVKWGRVVNDNIRRFLQYQLTINVAGVLLTFIVSLASSSNKEPFTPVQLLWLNLIMDTLAALALATERPSEENLKRPPIYKQSPLISRRMWSFIVGHGLYQLAIIIMIIFSGQAWMRIVEGPAECGDPAHFVVVDGVTQDNPITLRCREICRLQGGTRVGLYCQQGAIHSTITFNVFVFFQIFNMINARKIFGEGNVWEGLVSRSLPAVAVMVAIVGLQVLAIEVGGEFINTTPLSAERWGICIGLAATELIVGVLIRLLPIQEPTPDAVVQRKEKERILRDLYGEARRSSAKGGGGEGGPASGNGKIIVRQGDPALRRAWVSTTGKEY